MMTVNELIKNMPVRQLKGDPERLIRDIQYDSRKVEKDHAFVAIRGFQQDGHDFIPRAFENGARVFFIENGEPLPDSTFIYLDDTRRALVQIARIFFNYPDRKLKVIGVTGTTGKTTTAYLIFSILKSAGWNPGLMTTVASYNGKEWTPSERTTPEALDVHRNFQQMRSIRLKSAVMEVSSHALTLHRVEGIQFVAGVFTNLGRDHLDFHHDMENYFLAKRKLFEDFTENQRAILNLDDPYYERIRDFTRGEIFTFSMDKPAATVTYKSHQMTHEGLQATLSIPSGELRVESHLLGSYNLYNIMAATTTALSLGVNEDQVLEGIRNLKRVPGRCEHYQTPDGFSVYIDYAHTPESLQQILKTAWEIKPENLLVVFGAGGDRDRGKRPDMGKAADDYADKIFLTNDNPRSEHPEEIIDQIASGIHNRSKISVILDRKDAILEALHAAGSGDCVIIAGKGHETYQEIQDKRIPFDDHQVLETFYKENGWLYPEQDFLA